MNNPYRLAFPQRISRASFYSVFVVVTFGLGLLALSTFLRVESAHNRSVDLTSPMETLELSENLISEVNALSVQNPNSEAEHSDRDLSFQAIEPILYHSTLEAGAISDPVQSLTDEEQLANPFGFGPNNELLEQKAESLARPPMERNGDNPDGDEINKANADRILYLSKIERGEISELEREAFHRKVAKTYELLRSELPGVLERGFDGEVMSLTSDPITMEEMELALADIAQNIAADSMLFDQGIRTHELDDRKKADEISEWSMLTIMNP